MARPQFRTLLRWLAVFAEPFSNSTTRASFALCLVFFASGASALIFETLWFHQARLVLGSSVWAATLVPAAFMAGLGIGNAIAMRRGDQIAKPLRVYAILELTVAVCGVFLIYALPSLAAILTPVFRPLLERTAGLAALRFVVAFVLLAGPATAMGLTLPLLTRALSGSEQNFGRILGRLYGYNTLGAVAGAITSGAFLIGRFGIRGSGCIAGALNLVAAVGALLLAPRLTPSSNASAASTENVGLRHYAPHARWLAMAFLSGATLLALEVIWFRFLSLYVITNSLAFALMLAIVLSGIAIGGLFASQWLRWSPLAHRHCLFVATAAVLATVATYAVSPHVTAYFDIRVAQKASQILELGIPLMLPVSILSGILFTLTGAALEHRTQRQAATTGVLTLFNTAGATFGATAGGFLLIPQIGMEKSFFLMALLYAIIAALSFPREEKGAWRRGIVCALVCIASLTFFPFGSMQNDHFEVPIRRWSQRIRGAVASKEGLTETILYIERKFADRTRSQRLVTNAISMSSSDYRNGRYMKLFVYLPVAIHPQLEDALLISFGVGTTAKALTDTRELRRIDVVDISREILDMSRVVFPNSSDNPLHDPRVQVHIEDGRFFLQTTQRTYDLITSEPPPPNIDGVVNLYSREYFALVRNRLKEGGIVTYWLPTHSMAEHNSLAVARAFCDVFEDCSVWHGYGPDLMLVGTRQARGPVTEARFRAQWEDPTVRAAMHAVGFEIPAQLGALFIGGKDYLHELSANIAPVVDDFPERILAPYYFVSSNDQGIGLYGAWSRTDLARERFVASPWIASLWPAKIREETLQHFDAQRTINRITYRTVGDVPKDIENAHELLTRSIARAPVAWSLGSDADVQHILHSLSEEERKQPEVAYHVAVEFIASRQFEAALGPLEIAAKHEELGERAMLLRIYALSTLGRQAEAQQAIVDVQRMFAQSATTKKCAEWIQRTFAPVQE